MSGQSTVLCETTVSAIDAQAKWRGLTLVREALGFFQINRSPLYCKSAAVLYSMKPFPEFLGSAVCYSEEPVHLLHT